MRSVGGVGNVDVCPLALALKELVSAAIMAARARRLVDLAKDLSLLFFNLHNFISSTLTCPLTTPVTPTTRYSITGAVVPLFVPSSWDIGTG